MKKPNIVIILLIVSTVLVSGCTDSNYKRVEDQQDLEKELAEYEVNNISKTDCRTVHKYVDGNLKESTNCGIRLDVEVDPTDSSMMNFQSCIVVNSNELEELPGLEISESDYYDQEIVKEVEEGDSNIFYEVGNYHVEDFDLDFPCGEIHDEVRYN